MSQKVWKEYVRQHLEIVEGSAEQETDEGEKGSTDDISDLLDPESQSWCRTVDRCMAYTFESYCKLVVSSALQQAHANKGSVLTPEMILQSIERCFKLPQETREAAHDCERCLRHYRTYVRWFNRVGHRIYGVKRRRRWNLSSCRFLQDPLRLVSVYGKRSPASVVVDLRRYERVAPQHKSVTMSLKAVFGR